MRTMEKKLNFNFSKMIQPEFDELNANFEDSIILFESKSQCVENANPLI